MNKFTNIDSFPSDTKFSIFFKTQNLSTFIKTKYSHLENMPILSVLLYIFKKDKKYFTFENDYEEIVKNKIIEKTKTLILEKDRNEINILGADIAYFTNPILLDIWFNSFPEIFNNNYELEYNDIPNDINIENYNLLKSAIENGNCENSFYLVEKHKFSFWNNIDEVSCFKNKDIEYINKILELEPISLYKNNIDITEKYLGVLTGSEIKIQKKLFNTLMELDFLQKENYIENLLCNVIEAENLELLTYILKHKDFPYEYISNTFWNQLLNSIYNYNSIVKTKNHYKKTKIFHIILKTIISQYDSERISDIINKYDYNDEWINCLVRLPKITNTLDLIIDNININYLDEILTSIAKYGNLDTLEYFQNKFPNFLDKNDFAELIENSLYNRDNRITKNILEFYKPINNLLLHYKFLTVKSNQENKIKKLKLISKYVDIKLHIVSVINTLFFLNNDKGNIEVKKWVMKKLMNNKITENNFVHIIRLFNGIILEKNYEFIEYFLDLIDPKYNFWLLVQENLKTFTWFHKETQIILSYCEKYSKPIEDLGYNFKEILYINIISHYNNESYKPYNSIINQDNYVKAIQLFHNLGVKKCVEQQYLKLSSGNNNQALFKALLRCDYNFMKFYLNICDNQLHNIVNYEYKKWINLYNLVRRLRIRRDLKNKKEHKYLFQESVINMDTKPERDNTIINRGGPVFYKNMDELDNMCEINNFNYIYPKHILPHQLINICKGDISICQKTDGLLVKDIDKDILFPTISEEFEYIKMDGEYIKELDLYLVFGLRSHTKIHNQPIDDYNDLVLEHKLCQDFSTYDNFLDINHKEMIYKKLETEVLDIMEFCSRYKNEKNKWYPKKVWLFRDKEMTLNILDIIEKYQNDIHLKCIDIMKNLDMSSFITLNEFKTDGIILMKNKTELYKYKPKRSMTADILKGNEIYRCNWNEENNDWEPRDLREDKKYPNPKEVVDQLEYYHKYPWCIEDIIQYLDKININEIYYQHFLKDFEFTEFSNINKTIFNKILKDNYFRRSNLVLDLGCGFCNNILWKDPTIKIDGIEIDISVMESYNKLNKRSNLYIGDITQKWDTNINNPIKSYYNSNFSLTNIQSIYDIIIMNFSIQYVFGKKEGFSNFINELNSHSRKNTKLYISLIDLYDNIYLPRGSYIKIIDSKIDYEDDLVNKTIPYWIKTYYSFRHSNAIKEPMIHYENFKKLMEQNGWLVNKEFINEEKINNDWNQLLDKIKRIELIKII